MPTRFDHAVIAVRDLDIAVQKFQHLGFDVQWGGKHTGRGTHNALIRFGLDYIELLAVYDEDEARAFSNRTLLDELAGRDAALVGYALATTEIEQDAKRFRGTNEDLPLPSAMQRRRPDGQLLSWRILAPGDSGYAWNRPWPFLIQWDTPDEERLQIDRPGIQPNGSTGWTRIAIATRNHASVVDIYHNQLGLELIDQKTLADQDENYSSLRIGKGTIDIVSPDIASIRQQIRGDEDGDERPYLLTLAIKNMQQTRAFFDQRNIHYTYKSVTPDMGRLILDPGEALGVQMHFEG